MSTPMIDRLLAMLENGQDNAMLRFGLAQAYLQNDQAAESVEHFKRCLELDPAYSAAWKLLGKTLVELGDKQAAIETLNAGLAVAYEKGDKQAEKEMQVYLKRANKLP